MGALALTATAGTPAVIPAPQKMELRDGEFKLTPQTHIYVDSASRETGRFLAEQLRRSTGYPFKVSPKSGAGGASGAILLTTKEAKTALGDEGYELTVAPDSVVIRAPAQAGLFYGAQTLLQLLPPFIFSTSIVTAVSVTVPESSPGRFLQLSPQTISWTVPCVRIEDQPRFKWRGLMLDVSRHFFNKEEVKRFLDEMALQKLNTFHWHLVDDHGWRIEIKKYPRLTQVGAWRSGIGFQLDPKASTAYGPDGRYGGFYTQADIREIVAYAKARHITIIPEIEMPGHSTAALAAYPEFSCTGGPFTPELKGGVFNGVYCAGNDQTYVFLQNVLSEVFKLFPSKYIHIGGDEVPTANWQKCPKCQALLKEAGLTNANQIESYFIRRMEKFINAKGHNLIGWSEIREGGLAQNAAVMDWIGGAVEAASAGHDVIMSPNADCYLDHYQSQDHSTEPRAIGGYLPLSQVYGFEPMPAKLTSQYQSHILGAQGNIWTEYIPSFKNVEYMAYPRACALAEVTWSPKESRNWDDFMRRLQVHAQRLDELGVNYRRASVVTPEANPSK